MEFSTSDYQTMLLAQNMMITTILKNSQRNDYGNYAAAFGDHMITNLPLGAKQSFMPGMPVSELRPNPIIPMNAIPETYISNQPMDTKQFNSKPPQPDFNIYNPQSIKLPEVDFTILNTCSITDPYVTLLGEGAPKIPSSSWANSTIQNDTKPITDTNIGNNDAKHEPVLTIDDINTSFKVVSDLSANIKLKVIDNKRLATDDSYVYIFRSVDNGQGREAIINFLELMEKETKQHINKLLAEVKKQINVSNNIATINNIMHNMAVFMHNYHKIKTVYQADSTSCARLDNIYQNYINLESGIFRDILN